VPSGLITMQPDRVDERSERRDRVKVRSGVGEEDAGAAVDPAAIHEQRLVTVGQRGRDGVLVEVELGARSAIQRSNWRPAKPLSAMTRWPARGTRSSISRATSRSGGLAGASSKAIGVPSAAQRR
jgi:hypothetical protein